MILYYIYNQYQPGPTKKMPYHGLINHRVFLIGVSKILTNTFNNALMIVSIKYISLISQVNILFSIINFIYIYIVTYGSLFLLRSYYRCTHQKLYECQAKKQVQRLDQNPNIFEVTYRGNHTCHMSSTAPSSVPPQQLLVDISQNNSSTISSQLSPTMNLSLHPGGGGAASSGSGGASTSRYGGDYPVVDMADAMFNSGSSSGNNSMEFLFSPAEIKVIQKLNRTRDEDQFGCLKRGNITPGSRIYIILQRII